MSGEIKNNIISKEVIEEIGRQINPTGQSLTSAEQAAFTIALKAIMKKEVEHKRLEVIGGVTKLATALANTEMPRNRFETALEIIDVLLDQLKK